MEQSLRKVRYIEQLLALLLTMMQGLLLIRTWVLLGRDKRVLVGLVGLAAVIIMPPSSQMSILLSIVQACIAGSGVVGASERSMKATCFVYHPNL